MTTTQLVQHTDNDGSAARRVARRAFGSLAYCIGLAPLTLASLAKRDPARFWTVTERRLLDAAPPAGTVVGRRRAAHAALGIVYGVIGLVALGLTALFVARGVFYGLVDHGPYTDAWGGPSLAGAWAAHFGVAIGGMIATIAMTFGVTELHRRATRWLCGRALPRWFAPATTVLCLGVALFVVAFVRQL